MNDQINLPSFGQGAAATALASEEGLGLSLDLLKDIPLRVSVELGRTRLLISEILGLRTGAVVELDRQAGAAVDILVNGILFARGEVVVVDERFGVRITEVIGTGAIGSTHGG